MADGIPINAGTGGGTIATDLISSLHYQRNKLIFGADGTNSGDVSSANGLPVNAGLQSNILYNGTTQMTPKFEIINVTSTGDSTIKTGVTGKKIRVLSYVVTGDLAGTFRWESPAGTPISGLMVLGAVANGPSAISSGFNPLGHFETTSGGALSVEMATSDDLQGHFTYVEVA